MRWCHHRRRRPMGRELAVVDTAIAGLWWAVTRDDHRANGKLWYYSIMTWLIRGFVAVLLLPPHTTTLASNDSEYKCLLNCEAVSCVLCTNENQIIFVRFQLFESCLRVTSHTVWTLKALGGRRMAHTLNTTDNRKQSIANHPQASPIEIKIF